MPSVISFWQFPDEESRFIDYLTRKQDIWGSTLRRAADPAELQAQPLRDVLAQDDSDRLVMTPYAFKDLTLFIPYEWEGESRYCWNSLTAAAIGYSRPIWLETGELCNSSMASYSQRFAPDPSAPDGHSLVSQPPEFIAWQRRVFAWVRRHTQKLGYYRATPTVIDAYEAGRLRLTPKPHGG